MTPTVKRSKSVSGPKAVIAVFNSHPEAEAAVKELQRGGFDMNQLSVVGKDYHTEEQVVGYYNSGDRMKYWGKMGAVGRTLGLAVWRGVLLGARRRPTAYRRAAIGCIRCGLGKCGGGRRFDVWEPPCTAWAYQETAS